MKKLIQIFSIVMIVSAALLIWVWNLNSSQGYSSGNTLSIYNWGDYIDPDLIKKFEEESGMKIVYETFDSNEAMMTKIQQGGTSYDIAIPSEYAISKMKEAKLLLPLDHSKIPNLTTIDDRFLNLSFDRNNEYSVPYFWGTLGIIYNKDMVNGKELNAWNDLWDPEFRNKIFLVDSSREIIGMGLNSLGYSLNETDENRLLEAKLKLDQLTPNVKAIIGDEIKLLLANEEAAIGVTWSGEAADIMSENESLDYVVPVEGSNLWFDNMVIPISANNIEGAHEFINFMTDPENAAQNAEYVGYATPNREALKFLPAEVTKDRRFYPDPELTDKLEVYDNLGKKMLSLYNDLFLEFKMSK